MLIINISSKRISIDLRWNNVGLIGGRAILSLCQSNSTLNDFQLIGNNIPEDIMQSIGMHIPFFFQMIMRFEIPTSR